MVLLGTNRHRCPLNAGGVTTHSFFQIALAALCAGSTFVPLNSGYQKIQPSSTLARYLLRVPPKK
ncbi:MAG: hypothetical protein IPN97_11620 [Saprospiraceae bacterium]|nr:hypothetical protein [Saprospiraceae bacterium]